MKLLTKTNQYAFLMVASVLLVGAVFLHFTLQYVISKEVSEILETELEEFTHAVGQDPEFVRTQSTAELEISIVSKIHSPDAFRDTLIYSAYEEEFIPYLQLTAYRKINDQYFRFTFRESLIESNDIVAVLVGVFIVICLLLFIGIIMLNKYLSGHLWKPFYIMLDKLKVYEMGDQIYAANSGSDIEEFNTLQGALEGLSRKIHSDYNNLKEFTENASHELQTPLAIIKSEIDLLLQDSHLPDHLQRLGIIEETVNRVAATNKALLTLSKIENDQFRGKSTIDLSALITDILEQLSDFIGAKELTIQFANEPYEILKNAPLLRILFQNVLSNAVKHNVQQGVIIIRLEPNKIVIKNSSSEVFIDPDLAFQRFAKANPASPSPGLGLAIASKIAEKLELRLDYQIQEGLHALTLTF